MPRAKKKIKVEVHCPVLEKQNEFQEQVNTVYVDATKNYLIKNKVEKKAEVIEVLERKWSGMAP